MKKLRILGIVVFVIAAVSFGYFKYEQINSKDNQAPVITMDADSVEVSCQAGDEEFLKGITAKDSKDGDVTSSLIVESISNFMENHTRNMTVVAFDSDNHATKATRKIAYTDYTAPTFSLTEPLRFAMNTQDIMGTLTCVDVLDGDVTGKIKMSSEYYVQADVAGEYPMVYQVAKNVYANKASKYMNIDITRGLKEIDNSLYIVEGEAENNGEAIVEAYKNVNPSVEAVTLKETKHFPHVEVPEQFLEQVGIFF